jgi:NADH:ubiquinone oxidoreductase subunit 2 (subunit N)
VRQPVLALALAVCAFSLMGFPPTAGLLGKVYIFSSAFAVGDAHPFARPLVVLAVIGVLNSAIGAAYYLRIVAACYTRAPDPASETRAIGGGGLRWGVAICAVAMLVLFALPNLLTRDRGPGSRCVGRHTGAGAGRPAVMDAKAGCSSHTLKYAPSILTI